MKRLLSGADGSGGILRAVGVLAGGTAVAHVIIALGLPVATRIYTPADFSVLAVFTGVVTIIASAVCLRFDIAIPLPEESEEASTILVLGLTAAAAICLLLTIAIVLVPGWVAQVLGQDQITPYLPLIPLTIFFAGAYSCAQFYAVRHKAFRQISLSKVAQALLSVGAQSAIGLLIAGPLGLLVAVLVNVGVGSVVIGSSALRDRSLRFVSGAKMAATFRKYIRFPTLSTLEALCNAASVYLPVMLIASLASGPVAGHLLLAMQLLQAPMSLFGTAVSHAYLSRAPAEHRAGALPALTATILGGLFRAGIGPLLFVFVVAPDAFSIAFGAEWRPAGDLARWMVPWFAMQFLASPLGMALPVTGNQALGLGLQGFGVVIRVGAMFVAIAIAPQLLGEAYAVSGFVFYAAYLAAVLHSTRTGWGALTNAALRSIPLVLAWGVAGAAALLVIRGLGL